VLRDVRIERVDVRAVRFESRAHRGAQGVMCGCFFFREVNEQTVVDLVGAELESGTSTMMSSVATADDLYTWLDSQLATQVFAADSFEVTTNDSEEDELGLSLSSSEYRDKDEAPRVEDEEEEEEVNVGRGGGGGGDDDDDEEYAASATAADDDDDDDKRVRRRDQHHSRTRRAGHNKSNVTVPLSTIAPTSTAPPTSDTAYSNVSMLGSPTMMLPPPPQSVASATTLVTANSGARSGAPVAAPGRSAAGQKRAGAVGGGGARSTTTAVVSAPLSASSSSLSLSASASKRNKTQQATLVHATAPRRIASAWWPLATTAATTPARRAADRGLECSFQVAADLSLARATCSAQQADGVRRSARAAERARVDDSPRASFAPRTTSANASVAFLGSTPQYVMALRPRTPAETLALGIPLPMFSDANDEFCEARQSRSHAELKLTPLFEVLRPRGDASRWAGWAIVRGAARRADARHQLDASAIAPSHGWRQCKAHVKFYFQQDGPFAGRIAAVHGSIEHIGDRECRRAANSGALERNGAVDAGRAAATARSAAVCQGARSRRHVRDAIHRRADAASNGDGHQRGQRRGQRRGQ
jgi:hypothetical protein